MAAVAEAPPKVEALKAPIPKVEVAPKPSSNPVVASSTDSVKAEEFSRALLAARLDLEGKNRGAMPISQPKAEKKAAVPTTDPVKAEKTARALLVTRLQMAAKEMEQRKAEAEVRAKLKVEKKVVPTTDPVKAEKTARALLVTRLKMEAKEIAQRKAEAEAVKAEKTARALLVTRLQMEATEIAQRKAEAEAQAKALEEARMAKVQPKAKEVEAELASKYKSIEDLGERAFTILTDLGLVEQTPVLN